MKTNKFLMSALAAAMVIAGFSSCDKGGQTPTPDPDPEGLTLGGRLTEDLTLESGKTYMLTGSLQVVAPATLTIEPGVTIMADESAGSDNIIYILIEQGRPVPGEVSTSADMPTPTPMARPPLKSETLPTAEAMTTTTRES